MFIWAYICQAARQLGRQAGGPAGGSVRSVYVDTLDALHKSLGAENELHLRHGLGAGRETIEEF